MQLEKAMLGQARNRADTFDVEKGVAALAFLSQATAESMYSLLKMMYLADKLHLQRYGRFIAGDRYCAMKQGPVPSNAYGIFQHLRGEAKRPQFDVAANYFDYRPDQDHAVTLKQAPDLDELSAGELDCLETIVDTYRKYGKWAVRDLSHDDAWKEAWRTNFFRKATAMETAVIAQQFENSEVLLRHLQDSHPGSAELPPDFETKPVGGADRAA